MVVKITKILGVFSILLYASYSLADENKNFIKQQIEKQSNYIKYYHKQIEEADMLINKYKKVLKELKKELKNVE